MLKTRIIPILLWKDIGLVKGSKFQSWRRIGSILPAIKVYNARDVDELILLDITASIAGRDPDYSMIEDVASEMTVPLTVGGGVASLEIIEKVLKSGADKVAINSALLVNPEFARQAAAKFGSQCIVASIDVKKVDQRYLCMGNSGTREFNKDAVNWAKELAGCNVGEILLTSIDNDGLMSGYNLELIKSVSESVNVPVVAVGGAGSYEHMWEALTRGGATAVAAASMFHFTEQTPLAAKAFLDSKGIRVRKSCLID